MSPTGKKGSPWQHVTADEKPEIYITGKVVECAPPKRLVLSWADPDDLADKSRVTFEIEAIKDIVCLTVTHGNFEAGSTMAGRLAARAFEHEIPFGNRQGTQRLRWLLNDWAEHGCAHRVSRRMRMFREHPD